MKKDSLSIILLVGAVLLLIGSFFLYRSVDAALPTVRPVGSGQRPAASVPAPANTAQPTPAPTPAPTSSPTPAPTDSPYPAATDFVFSDRYGKDYRLSDFYGKPIVINFFATWCGPCMYEIPGLNAVYLQYKDQVNFLVIDWYPTEDISIDEVFNFIVNSGYSFPLYYDTRSQGMDAYGEGAIPLTILVSADGRVVDTHLGSMEQQDFENLINKLLNG